MKVVFKLAVLGLIIGAVMNYAAYQKSGHMPLAGWFADVKKSAVNWVGQDSEPTVKSPIKVSKWTDAKGVVHYENRPV